MAASFPMPEDLLIRPMSASDVARAEHITDEAFFSMDVEFGGRAWPTPRRRTQSHRERWAARTAVIREGDPGGCWVAEVDGEVVGVATSVVRDKTWILCTYAVLPGIQTRGIGRPLLEAALTHGKGCLRGMFASSSDPRAVRLYLQAGFTLEPWMFIHGELDRSAIPTGSQVRIGTASDLDLLDSLDRRLREAAHGKDHEWLLGAHPLLVVDRPSRQGYAFVSEGGGVQLLAASDRRTATELLWEALAMSTPGDTVSTSHISAANGWALRVAVEGRLGIHTSGYLALRGMKAPMPYIPHGALL